MSDDAAVAWLRAQIEGDKSLAGKAGGKAWHVASWLPDDARRVEGEGITIYDEGGHDEHQAAHIALHDPQGVIADCEAKLAILDADDTQYWTLTVLARGYRHRVGYADHWEKA